MKFLELLGFNKEEIDYFVKNNAKATVSNIKKHKKLVEVNVNYLKDLGVENYQEVFAEFSSMFLMDASNFKEIFDRYESKSLVEKIKENVNIVEFL